MIVMMGFISIFGYFFCTLALYAVSLVVLDIYTWYYLPPGPFPLPFIGNIHLLSPSQPWYLFSKWAKVYGPIYTIWVGRQPTLIISDPAVAAELFEKRGSIYNSRPRSIMLNEVFFQNNTIILRPYSKRWLAERRLLGHALSPTVITNYKPWQEAEASKLCSDLIRTPGSWERALERFVASLICSVAYGRRIDDLNSKVIQTRIAYLRELSVLVIPGAYIVEQLTWLKHIPNFLAPWKKKIEDRGNSESAFSISLVNGVRKDFESNTETPGCLTEKMLRVKEQGDQKTAESSILFSDRAFAALPGAVMNAGTETSSSTILIAIYALITHPIIFQRARAEIDRVVGSSRSPRFSDEAALPYISALCKEVLRWRPASPPGLPHATIQSDTFRGWKIPKNTTLLYNAWAINLHPEYFPLPHAFDPAHYLSPDHQHFSAAMRGKSFPGRYGHSGFGWGRRICPGADLVMNSMFMALSKIIWGFEMMPVEGAKFSDEDFKGDMLLKPKFEAIFKIREGSYEAIFKNEMRDAEEVLAGLKAFE